ncbi:uncharacterized protein LOC118764472 [Octopus sinensis]|uniref:Uncharacterized protein LOC118764472 n=1 Tax=Octopus sinensis TaxID=2607531 RepID=A0A7E6F2D3_9MOLL|nr:uncharacterized protein LOC118764472 [Octopus sinensis]
MNSTQRFLYTQATRPLISGPVENSKKRSSIIDYKNVFLRPTFKESIVCEAYDMKIPAYSVEVDSDSFWKFLYSNKWKDCCMIRVKPGFLNTDLTMTLATLLENKQISSHKTVGFIKFRSSNINEVKPQKYGTIRLEFTYFGRNTEYIGRSKSEVFRKERKVNKTTSLKSRLESNIIHLERLQETIQKRIKISQLTEYDKIKSIRLINANLTHFHCSEPINLRDVLDTGDSPEERLASIFKPPTVQRTIKSQPILQRPKHTRETKCKTKDPQPYEDPFNQTYLQPINTDNMSFQILGSILRHEDKQKTLGYKVRVSKLFLSDKLLTKTRNMLEKTVLDAELGQIKKSAEPPTETKNAETEGSTISYSKWKKFSEKAFGIIGSQEIFRALLNSHPDCPKMIFKRSLARLKGYGRLDRIFKKKSHLITSHYSLSPNSYYRSLSSIGVDIIMYQVTPYYIP